MENSETRILVAEDDEIVRSLVVVCLEDAGFDVLDAPNGVEALHLIGEPDRIDLLVTDINMPDPNGIAVAIRAQGTYPDMKVLFMSGESDKLALSGLKAGYRFLPKPFTVPRLLAAVDALLRGV
jgi:DNA-binding response OmpR family regulator